MNQEHINLGAIRQTEEAVCREKELKAKYSEMKTHMACERHTDTYKLAASFLLHLVLGCCLS